MMALPKGVTAYQWEQARRRVIATAQVCAICGRELLPNARPRSRWSTSVDHRIPRAKFKALPLETQRHLALDPSNLQATHLVCNARKGKRPQRVVAPRPQSQRW